MNTPPIKPSAPKPTWRKPVGIIAMLIYVTVYCSIIVSQWSLISAAPILAQAAIYLVLGVIWIAPLKPLLIWMETGKWRE